MLIKEYLSLMLKTIYAPSRVFKRLLELPFKFHVLYYSVFTFVFGTVMAFNFALNPESINTEQMAFDGIYDVVGSLLIGIPILMILTALYFNFANYHVFKATSAFKKYLALLLWAIHYFIMMLLLIVIPSNIISLMSPELGLFVGSLIVLFLILQLCWMGLLAANIALTKSWWRTIAVYAIGSLFFYIPVYLFAP